MPRAPELTLSVLKLTPDAAAHSPARVSSPPTYRQSGMGCAPQKGGLKASGRRLHRRVVWAVRTHITDVR
eukprot:6744971-Prymnesium_polylepis.1